MKRPEEMTEDELREFVKKLTSVYIENVNIIACTPIRIPETIIDHLNDYSRN